MPIQVITFYQFTPIDAPASHRATLLASMQALGIKGTVTLAGEGVNATISGVADAVRSFIDQLQQQLSLRVISAHHSITATQPFQRSKVKVKRELISLGTPAEPALCVGQHIAPDAWNALISRDDVTLIDTRNDFEFAHGHFRGAINPGTRNFKEMVRFTEEQLLPLGRNRAIAMYCTGGIRCEKYSSYLVAQGYRNVYHLRGGILAYLDTVPAHESLWQGECFVFDERVSVGMD